MGGVQPRSSANSVILIMAKENQDPPPSQLLTYQRWPPLARFGQTGVTKLSCLGREVVGSQKTELFRDPHGPKKDGPNQKTRRCTALEFHSQSNPIDGMSVFVMASFAGASCLECSADLMPFFAFDLLSGAADEETWFASRLEESFSNPELDAMLDALVYSASETEQRAEVGDILSIRTVSLSQEGPVSAIHETTFDIPALGSGFKYIKPRRKKQNMNGAQKKKDRKGKRRSWQDNDNGKTNKKQKTQMPIK
ncbi:hypothetical protein QOT17_016688 [Balamuthia mandrillaris]